MVTLDEFSLPILLEDWLDGLGKLNETNKLVGRIWSSFFLINGTSVNIQDVGSNCPVNTLQLKYDENKGV